jgi:hypothetical protein
MKEANQAIIDFEKGMPRYRFVLEAVMKKSYLTNTPIQ